MKKHFIFTLFIFLQLPVWSSKILIPMDKSQTDHLKAYGITYWILSQGTQVSWLLNYRGGSFMTENFNTFAEELTIRNVKYEIVSNAEATRIVKKIFDPSINMEVIKLEKTPKIAVYSPKNKQPWDDAVTLVLTYAEIPYTILYDDEILDDKLKNYDWLHLHHEDFTGQYGKFYANYKNATWYKEQVRYNEEVAFKHSYTKVSQLKLAVALNIKKFTSDGGFLFAMCSGTDALDIALTAQGVDICESMYDGDPAEPNFNEKLNFKYSLAFENFKIKKNPLEYEFSNIDATPSHNKIPEKLDVFTLFEFSAKWDPVPTMLCQNHEQTIKGFFGQTTDYYKEFVKQNVKIMGETKSTNSVKYIHGNIGKGMWTFYGGHDPEDYRHYVGDPPTELKLYPNSPGYRLILNNILFPAAKKKKRKT